MPEKRICIIQCTNYEECDILIHSVQCINHLSFTGRTKTIEEEHGQSQEVSKFMIMIIIRLGLNVALTHS